MDRSEGADGRWVPAVMDSPPVFAAGLTIGGLGSSQIPLRALSYFDAPFALHSTALSILPTQFRQLKLSQFSTAARLRHLL